MSQSGAKEHSWERGIAVESSAFFLKAHIFSLFLLCSSLCSLVPIWMPGRGASITFRGCCESRHSVAGKSIGCLVTPCFQKDKTHFYLSERRKGLRYQCIRSWELSHQNTESSTGCYLLREMPSWNLQGLCFLPCKRTVKNESCQSVLRLFSPDITHSLFFFFSWCILALFALN